MKLRLMILFVFLLTGCAKEPSIVDKFDGLEPKAVFEQYKIYDIVEQRNLPCAEAIEFIGEDPEYDYFFNCLKSGQIYFVSTDEIINVHNVFKAEIITLEELYELKIISRMEKSN